MMANFKRIYDLCEKNCIKLNDLSIRSGVEFYAMMDIINKGEGSIADLQKLADTLHINPAIFFVSEDEAHEATNTSLVIIYNQLIKANNKITRLLGKIVMPVPFEVKDEHPVNK